MSNSITEGKDRELPPDRHGEIVRAPTPAAAELKAEVMEAWQHKQAGQGDAMRARSTIESRTDLRLAATNEAMRADPTRSVVTGLVEQETARRWAELDATDFSRIRSDVRRENALEAIAGHMRTSPEYADELKKRSPALAEAGRTLNDERAKLERQAALPTIERNAASLAPGGSAAEIPESAQRQSARQDAKSLAALPEGSERQFAAAVIGKNAREHQAYREELQQVAPDRAREAAAALVERDLVRGVEKRAEHLQVVARDALPVKQAREAVQEDVAALGAIKDPGARALAASAMGDAARHHVTYRAELQLQAPEVAKEVQSAASEHKRRLAEKEERKAAEFAAMQAAKIERAASWTPEQAVEQVRKDLASLRVADATERRYTVGDMATAMGHSKAYGEALTKEAPEVAREVETRRERDAAEQLASGKRSDKVNAAAQSRAALIDASAHAAVASVRARETARVVDQLASAPDTATQQLRDAQQALKAPPLDGRVTAPNDPDIDAQRGRAIKRPVTEEELSQTLLTRYVVSREKHGLLDKASTEFTFRSGEEQGRVAFVDVGKTLSTERDDKSTIRAMIEVAAAKNWKEITVSGTDDFRRNAWLEARLNGMQVRGYEPRAADKQMLAEMQERKQPSNTITAVDHERKRDEPQEQQKQPTQQRRHIDGDALTPQEKSVLDSSRSILNSRALGEQFTQATLRELESKLRGERVYVGEVVDHGRAPYKFDKSNDESYFVTLKTRAGEEVIWGKGLAEAMHDRRAGEQIVLQNTGKRDVVVQERVLDSQGAIVGSRPKESQLNAWKSELLSRVSEKARADLEARTPDRQPSIGVYDPKADRPAVQRSTAARGAEQQRSTEQQRNSRER